MIHECRVPTAVADDDADVDDAGAADDVDA